jgi:hypothetical protein
MAEGCVYRTPQTYGFSPTQKLSTITRKITYELNCLLRPPTSLETEEAPLVADLPSEGG